MATWLIEHGDLIAWMVLAFIVGVVFAAWRQTSIEDDVARTDRAWVDADSMG